MRHQTLIKYIEHKARAALLMQVQPPPRQASVGSHRDVYTEDALRHCFNLAKWDVSSGPHGGLLWLSEHPISFSFPFAQHLVIKHLLFTLWSLLGRLPSSQVSLFLWQYRSEGKHPGLTAKEIFSV